MYMYLPPSPSHSIFVMFYIFFHVFPFLSFDRIFKVFETNLCIYVFTGFIVGNIYLTTKVKNATTQKFHNFINGEPHPRDRNEFYDNLDVFKKLKPCFNFIQAFPCLLFRVQREATIVDSRRVCGFLVDEMDVAPLPSSLQPLRLLF